MPAFLRIAAKRRKYRISCRQSFSLPSSTACFCMLDKSDIKRDNPAFFADNSPPSCTRSQPCYRPPSSTPPCSARPNKPPRPTCRPHWPPICRSCKGIAPKRRTTASLPSVSPMPTAVAVQYRRAGHGRPSPSHQLTRRSAIPSRRLPLSSCAGLKAGSVTLPPGPVRPSPRVASACRPMPFPRCLPPSIPLPCPPSSSAAAGAGCLANWGSAIMKTTAPSTRMKPTTAGASTGCAASVPAIPPPRATKSDSGGRVPPPRSATNTWPFSPSASVRTTKPS